ncbi:MAG TPA: Gfo/Idh/MocA family oxidoreductase, partial [Acidimicrobiales bacterium]|nr:Gfo/Idh/MocA family oxidoreductase [Acidimicrobiales bacterium]
PESSLEAVLARDDIDVVSLCTPPWLHLDQALAVLASGRDVVVEKPIAGSVADVDRLVAAEAASGRRVVPVFQYRFGAGVQRLRHLVASGVTGRCHTATVEVAWRRRADYYTVPWRGTWAGELGGALASHGLHAIDMTHAVLGPPARVMGRACTRVNPVETEDTAAALLEWADGTLGTLSITLGSSAEISRHRFSFERLSAESGTSPYDNGADPWVLTPDDDAATAAIAAATDGWTPGPEGFIGLFAAAADALVSGRPLPVTLADARAALEIVAAVHHSSRTGEWVELPISAEHVAARGWGP